MKKLAIVSLTVCFLILSNSANFHALALAQDKIDENERDFAAHGEIDYTKVDLFASGRVCPPPLAPPDYDHYTGKVLFAANVSNEGMAQLSDARTEIFIAEAKEGKSDDGKDLIMIDYTTQKRLTYDSSDNFGNYSPFWTADRNIVYIQTRYDIIKPKYFMISKDGNRIKEIKTERESERLFYKSHNKDRTIKIPPPK